MILYLEYDRRRHLRDHSFTAVFSTIGYTTRSIHLLLTLVSLYYAWKYRYCVNIIAATRFRIGFQIKEYIPLWKAQIPCPSLVILLCLFFAITLNVFNKLTFFNILASSTNVGTFIFEMWIWYNPLPLILKTDGFQIVGCLLKFRFDIMVI